MKSPACHAPIALSGNLIAGLGAPARHDGPGACARGDSPRSTTWCLIAQEHCSRCASSLAPSLLSYGAQLLRCGLHMSAAMHFRDDGAEHVARLTPTAMPPRAGARCRRFAAPSSDGVLLIGAALVLRDLVQRRLGVEFGIGAIVCRRHHFRRPVAAIDRAGRRRRRFCSRNLSTLRSIRRRSRPQAAGLCAGSAIEHSRPGGRLDQFSSGLPSARSISWPGRSSARPGWC